MRCLERNKRELYICEKYQDGMLTKYREPKQIFVNHQVTNSEGDLIALGMEYPMYVRIKTELEMYSSFHAGDRVYINIQPNEPFDELCKDANYEVDSEPIVSLNVVEVTLKRLSGKNGRI